MSEVARTIEISWARALKNPSQLAWGRIADMLWGISIYVLNKEIEVGHSSQDYEDVMALYDIANWRAYHWKSTR